MVQLTKQLGIGLKNGTKGGNSYYIVSFYLPSISPSLVEQFGKNNLHIWHTNDLELWEGTWFKDE